MERRRTGSQVKRPWNNVAVKYRGGPTGPRRHLPALPSLTSMAKGTPWTSRADAGQGPSQSDFRPGTREPRGARWGWGQVGPSTGRWGQRARPALPPAPGLPGAFPSLSPVPASEVTKSLHASSVSRFSPKMGLAPTSCCVCVLDGNFVQTGDLLGP